MWNSGQISRRQTLGIFASLPAAALLTGCVDLPAQDAPPRQFRLTPKSTFDEGLPTVEWSLIVEEPESQSGLDTSRIALLRAGTEIEYYAKSDWSARAPEMVQGLVIESFTNSGLIGVVVNERTGLRSDFVLKSELREFQADFTGGGAPTGNVGLNATLVQMPRRDVIGTESFGSTVPAGSDTLEDVVAAMDEALGKVIKDLVAWTVQTGNAAEPAG